VITSTRLPCLRRPSTWACQVRAPFRWPAQALELACRVRAPFRWRLAPPAEGREHHDVRIARGKVSVFGGTHATVDVASAVDAVRGGIPSSAVLRGDRVHR